MSVLFIFPLKINHVFLFEQIYINNLADLPRSKLGKADFFSCFSLARCVCHISAT